GVDFLWGLHPYWGDTADDLVLPASVTATFGGVKAGLAIGRGPELASTIVLVELGLDLDPAEAVAEASVDRIVRG
ncbi:MAG: NAD(P)H-hydrate epimerase, partial [Microbacterium sp.]